MSEPQAKEVNAEDVADVLRAMAALMDTFRQHDLALQNALSSVTLRARAAPQMESLQHVDLITQTHNDLGKLLPMLADVIGGRQIEKQALREALTLRSLQDALIDGVEEQDTPAGELALF